jgi:hypothetical protein
MASVLDGVRPAPGAAKGGGPRGWVFVVGPKCLHCCARGRAHSDAGLFKQALSEKMCREIVWATFRWPV